MTDKSDIAHLTLEHLKYIRSSVDRIENDLQDIKSRVTNLEEALAGANRRLDRTDLRLAQIEKRTGLIDA